MIEHEVIQRVVTVFLPHDTSKNHNLKLIKGIITPSALYLLYSNY